MDSEGIVYDAFEFKRFVDPERTVYADGQSIWEDGKPWHPLLDLGTNVFQKITGPDGNPLGNFDGGLVEMIKLHFIFMFITCVCAIFETEVHHMLS